MDDPAGREHFSLPPQASAGTGRCQAPAFGPRRPESTNQQLYGRSQLPLAPAWLHEPCAVSSTNDLVRASHIRTPLYPKHRFSETFTSQPYSSLKITKCLQTPLSQNLIFHLHFQRWEMWLQLSPEASRPNDKAPAQCQYQNDQITQQHRLWSHGRSSRRFRYSTIDQHANNSNSNTVEPTNRCVGVVPVDIRSSTTACRRWPGITKLSDQHQHLHRIGHFRPRALASGIVRLGQYKYGQRDL